MLKPILTVAFQLSSAKSGNTNPWRQQGHRWMWQHCTALPWSIHLPKPLLSPQTPHLLKLEPAQFYVLVLIIHELGLIYHWALFHFFSFCHGFGHLLLLLQGFLPYIHYDMGHNF